MMHQAKSNRSPVVTENSQTRYLILEDTTRTTPDYSSRLMRQVVDGFGGDIVPTSMRR